MNRLILTLGIVLSITLKGDAVLFEHLGCYVDNPASPELNGKEVILTSINIKDCANGCTSDGYAYAGFMAGTRCLCGQEYGKGDIVPTSACNYTCPLEAGSTATDSCGGVNKTSVFYAVDSDPATRADRIFVVYSSSASWINARQHCVKRNGDLATLAGEAEVNTVTSIANTTAGMTSSNVWIGLYKMSHLANLDFTWTDVTSFGMDYSGYWDTTANTFDPNLLCVHLITTNMKLKPADCSTSLPFVCKQLPNPDATTAATER